MSEAGYNKQSCDMARQPDDDAVLKGPPGSFCIERRDGLASMPCMLPGSTYIEIAISTNANADPRKGKEPVWQWDGNEDKPTLKPSVHAHKHWHGWLRNGRMESC